MTGGRRHSFKAAHQRERLPSTPCGVAAGWPSTPCAAPPGRKRPRRGRAGRFHGLAAVDDMSSYSRFYLPSGSLQFGHGLAAVDDESKIKAAAIEVLKLQFGHGLAAVDDAN